MSPWAKDETSLNEFDISKTSKYVNNEAQNIAYPHAGKSNVAKESIWQAESRAKPPLPRAASPSLKGSENTRQLMDQYTG